MATIGHGSKLQLGDGAGSESFQDIAGVLSIDFGSNKVDTLDTTAMNTSGSKRTFIGGLEDEGDVTVKLNFLPGDGSQATLRTAKDGLPHDFKAVYPGSVATVSFAAIVVSIDDSLPDDKLVTFTAKLKITGARTRT